MKLRYLVDTDWVIDYLNGRAGIVERLDQLPPEGLGLSVISLAELFEGVFYSRDAEGAERDLHDFLRTMRIVPLDENVCEIFGRERGRLRAVGTLIGDFDLLIWATALQHSLVLLTNNRRHFELIEGLRLLSQ
jgi:tRNA(fMet)-specific endonuclease VapC